MKAEEKRKNLKDYILGLKKDNASRSVFEDYFCEELADFLIGGLINDDFRQYFYSYPKGCYIKTIEESELENILLFQQKELPDNFDELVEKSLLRKGKVIGDSIQILIESKSTLPLVILKNSKLLAYCYQKFPDQIVSLMRQNLLWNEANCEQTITLLNQIKSYEFNGNEDLIRAYASNIAELVGTLGQSSLKCRVGIVNSMASDILLFSDIYFAPGSPCLTKQEIEIIENEKTVFSLIDEKKFDYEALIALSEKFNSPLTEDNYLKLSNCIDNFIKINPVSPIIARSIIKILSANQKVDNNIFNYLSNCIEVREELISYINQIGGNITTEYCQTIEKLRILGALNLEAIIALWNNKCYFSFLANAIINNFILEECYDINAISALVIKEIHDINPELFYNYRLNLLKQPLSVKSTFKFLYLPPYAFLNEQEMAMFTCEDGIELLDRNIVLKYDKEYINLCSQMVKGNEDLYNVSKFLLNLKDSRTLNIFAQLPFHLKEYCKLDLTKQKEILALYEDQKPIKTADEIIKYMDLTQALNEELETRLHGLFKEANPSIAIWKEYLNLLNSLNAFTTTTLIILNMFRNIAALPSKITDVLYEKGEYYNYIIGKTLSDSSFDYNSNIPLDIYIEVYVDMPEVANLMKTNDGFLNAIYEAQEFDSLNNDLIAVFGKWDQKFVLFKAAMEILESDNDRKIYILNVPKFATAQDNDDIADYICQEKYVSLILDDEVKDKIMFLLWDDHKGKKIKFSKFVNKHKKVA